MSANTTSLPQLDITENTTLTADKVKNEGNNASYSFFVFKNQDVRLADGITLTLKDHPFDGTTGNECGLIVGSKITGKNANLYINISESNDAKTAFGQFGSTTIDVNKLVINSEQYGIRSQGKDSGTTSVTAKNIDIDTKDHSVFVGHDVTTLQGFESLSITSREGSAIKLNGGSVNIISDADNATVLIKSTEDEAIDVRQNSTLNIRANTVNVIGVIESKGTFNLNGNLILNGDSAHITTLTGDNAKFTFANAADQTVLTVDNNYASLTIAADSKVVSTIEGLQKMAKVTNAENGNLTWFIDGGLDGDDITETDGKTTYKTSKGVKVLKTFGTSLSKAAVLGLKNDVRKRLGDIRHVDAEQGAWVRYEGGRMSASGYSNKLNTLQIGYDTKALADGVRLGAAVSYTRNDADLDGGAADGDTYALSLYSTWMGDNGMYADVIARVASIKNDVTVLNGSQAFSDDMSNTAYSVTGEFGQRFDIAKTFFVEPQVEMVYTYVDSGKLKLNNGSYKYDSIDSLIGRAGMVFGWNCPNDKGHVYFRASALHEFKGDSKLTTNSGNTYKTDGQDTWAEIGLGAQYNVNKNIHVWADVERTQGADINEDFRGTLGVRVSF